MLFPLVWLVVLVWSGIGADRVRFTLRDAWFLAVGTLVAIGILAHGIRRERGCAAKSLPAFLLFFFVMNLFVLWVWNV